MIAVEVAPKKQGNKLGCREMPYNGKNGVRRGAAVSYHEVPEMGGGGGL